jgi:hypothetical protein
MSSDVLEEYCDEKYRLQIIIDFDPPNPRKDWDQLSVIVAWHRNYDLSDTDEFETPEDFVREMKRRKQRFYNLYMFDHSQIALSIEPFGGPYAAWDSGQVGFVYIPNDVLRENLGVKRLTAKHREKAREWIEGDLETYTSYINGDVYGYKITERDSGIPPCTDADLECYEPEPDELYNEEVEACWGFFGWDPAKNGMKDNVSAELQYLFDKV